MSLRRWLLGIAVLAILAAAYAPVFWAGFSPWDDRLYTAENPLVRNGLSVPGVAGAFSSTWENNWSPVFWIFLAAQVSVAGGAFPGVFHTVSILLSLLNAGLLVAVAQRFSIAFGAALLAAALYAAHPLRVEAVAWISAQKHLLATAFLLLALLSYRRTESGGKWHVFSLAAYGMSLMSSQIGVGFPIFLLVWEALRAPAGVVRWKTALAKSAAFFLLAGGAAVATLWVNWRPSAQAVAWFDHPLPHRILQAVGSLGWQASAVVWPAGLAGFYPWPSAKIGLFVLLGILTLFGLAWCGWKFRQSDPLVAAGLAGFLACFFPVSGLLAMPIEFTADRLTYLPAVFLALALGAALNRSFRQGRSWPACLCALWALALLPVTFRQATFWRSERAIVDRTLSHYPDSVPAQINDATLAGLEKNPEEALKRFRTIRASHPLHEVVWSNEMALLLQAGRTGEALAIGEEAVRHIPASPPLNYQVGLMLNEAGREREALRYLRKARELSPQAVQPAFQLAHALVKTGEVKEAIPLLELLAISLQGDPEYWKLRGEAHDRNGDWQKAAQAREAAKTLRARQKDSP